MPCVYAPAFFHDYFFPAMPVLVFSLSQDLTIRPSLSGAPPGRRHTEQVTGATRAMKSRATPPYICSIRPRVDGEERGQARAWTERAGAAET